MFFTSCCHADYRPLCLLNILFEELPCDLGMYCSATWERKLTCVGFPAFCLARNYKVNPCDIMNVSNTLGDGTAGETNAEIL
jgi:hypothetical protein